MGYTTVAYGVDLDRLAQVGGSRDVELLADLERENADQLAIAEHKNAELSDPSIKLRNALREIVTGILTHYSDDGAAQYVYAYQLLCEHFGRPLDGREHVKFLEDLEWETGALEFRTPLGLPKTWQLPFTSYLTPNEACAEYDCFKDYDGEEDDAWLAEAREESIWWLKQCADENESLVVFTY
ncbi:MAG: hypothetical protein WD669_03910 [Pirellulales bacterium]